MSVVVVVIDPREAYREDVSWGSLVNDVAVCDNVAEANAYIDAIQALDGKGRWQFLIQPAQDPKQYIKPKEAT